MGDEKALVKWNSASERLVLSLRRLWHGSRVSYGEYQAFDRNIIYMTLDRMLLRTAFCVGRSFPFFPAVIVVSTEQADVKNALSQI